MWLQRKVEEVFFSLKNGFERKQHYRICVHSHLSVEGGFCCSSFSGFGVEMKFRLTECENLGV